MLHNCCTYLKVNVYIVNQYKYIKVVMIVCGSIWVDVIKQFMNLKGMVVVYSGLWVDTVIHYTYRKAIYGGVEWHVG